MPDYEEVRLLSVDKELHVLKDAMRLTCHNMQQALCKQKAWSAESSGSTLTGVILWGDSHIISFNVGDSRSIMLSEKGVTQLTDDHKPEVPAESSRIKDAGGKIERAKDIRGKSTGPFRIWNDDRTSPGLAMSRSLGDRHAHTLGCSCDPDVHIHEVTADDHVFIMASDGVWDQLSNEQVQSIVYPYYIDATRIASEPYVPPEEKAEGPLSRLCPTKTVYTRKAAKAAEALVVAAQQGWQ